MPLRADARCPLDRNEPESRLAGRGAEEALVDHHRRRGGRSVVSLELVEGVADGYSEDTILASMDVERLLSGIPAWQSELIRRVRLEGRSVAEAAAASGKTEAMVKVSVHRGIKALAARLRGERGENG